MCVPHLSSLSRSVQASHRQDTSFQVSGSWLGAFVQNSQEVAAAVFYQSEQVTGPGLTLGARSKQPLGRCQELGHIQLTTAGTPHPLLP